MATRDPFVTCIMPTRDRRGFVMRAIEYFRRQDYPQRELIVVDDGNDPVADLAAGDPRIRYVRLDHHLTIGAKRNIACEAARGEIILHWDDDDWMASWRISHQVTYLIRRQADICGLTKLFYYDLVSGQGWQYIYHQRQSQPWVAGCTLCYTRAAWQTNPFLNLSVGEDAHFVWNRHPSRVIVPPHSDFYVAFIHGGNVAPKQPDRNWYPYPAARLQRLMGDDLSFHTPQISKAIHLGANSNTNASAKLSFHSHQISNLSTGASTERIRNVFACLVHEDQESVVDLVRNLRYFDPSSQILLYNGGEDRGLLERGNLGKYEAMIYPNPHPLKWGRLHDFALDCMRFALEHVQFDVFTIVDSDQMSIRPNYSQFLASYLEGKKNVGLLSNAPQPQGANTTIPPARDAHKEFELWRPFLRRFPHGEDKYVYWSFWPSTVFTADAARGLTNLFSTDTQLQDIMNRTNIWASEEIILPTLVALLGYEIAAHPCSFEYVKYRETYSRQQVDAALAETKAYWIHPIPRRYNNELRKHIRTLFHEYNPLHNAVRSDRLINRSGLVLTQPILRQMNEIEGWLTDDEADLLIAASARVLAGQAQHNIVEVGSYCGRSTVVLGSVAKMICPSARVYAIDPHDGKVGATDRGLRTCAPTLEKFKHNIAQADLTHIIEIIQKYSFEVIWEKPISLLFIDGLHDYMNVARDFFHFQSWVIPGGYVCFHDYADYYPGVQALVNEVLATRRYRRVGSIRSMIVLERLSDKMN